MKAVIYARVSTDEQARSGLGIHGQLARCRAWADYNGHDVIAELTENGCSGSKAPADRPEMSKALAMLEAGEAAVLVAAKLDRIGRDVRDVLALVADADRAGWNMAILDLNLDTSTATGRLFLTMLASFAEFERNVIAERTSAALQAKKARGARLGAPVRLSGEALARVAAVRAEGLSLSATARQLQAEGIARPNGGKWSATAVKRAEESARLDAEAAAAKAAAKAAK